MEDSTAEDSSSLLEGDIIPSWTSIATVYGEDTAKDLGLQPPSSSPSETTTIGTDHSNHNSTAKKGITNMYEILWNNRASNDKISIPYEFTIGRNGEYTNEEKRVISSALDELADLVGIIQFIIRTNEVDYVQVRDDGGCSSYIGRIGGPQELNLGWCKTTATKGQIQHEMMHTLGISHEQR